MPFEKKDGTGALFKNDKKGNANWPDYKGDILINGVEYWLSAWIKEGKKGKFMSLSVNPKEQRQAATRAPSRQRDDIPDF